MTVQEKTDLTSDRTSRLYTLRTRSEADEGLTNDEDRTGRLLGPLTSAAEYQQRL